jgi:hypothetical protein
MTAFGASLLLVAGVWLNLRLSPASRTRRTAMIALLFVVVAGCASALRWTRDVSEDRRNSFAPVVEQTLRGIHDNVQIDVNLASEDPRLADLRTNVIARLERVLPSLTVRYTGGSGTGMFAAPGTGYGETWYQVGSRRAMTHSVAEPIVLDVLYGLAGVTPPPAEAGGYPGYPLVARPAGVAALFYVMWPALVLLMFVAARRPLRRSARLFDT